MGISSIKHIFKGDGREDVIAAINYLHLNGVYVEVGTFAGGFSLQLARRSQPGRLFCVDPYKSYETYHDSVNVKNLDDIFNQAQGLLSPYADRVEFIRDFSVEASTRFPDNSLDFVYIDANHQFEYVLADLLAWYPKVRPGGLLCGDDVIDVDESKRESDGNVPIIWERNVLGVPINAGRYGTLHALRKFCSETQLEVTISKEQFLILK